MFYHIQSQFVNFKHSAISANPEFNFILGA